MTRDIVLRTCASLVLICSSASELRAQEVYARLPLSFEVNQGQVDPRVKFLSRGPGQTLFLTATEAVLAWKTGALRMTLAGANRHARVSGVEPLPGRVNYLIGRDPTQWHSDVPTYRAVHYDEIYPGIEAVYYGNPQQLEYDFVIAPGAHPDRIRLHVDADRISLDERGNAVLHAGDRDVRLERPVVYQTVNGQRREIAAGYALKGHELRFQVAAYDHREPLVIDPVLAYATYLGGSGPDAANAIAVDGRGAIYVTGEAYSANFPLTPGAYQSTPGNPTVAFVTKIDPKRSGAASLVYSTFLGGTFGSAGYGVAVDDAGDAYVAGMTNSTDFPVTAAAFQLTSHGADAFFSTLNADGTALMYSTFFGGTGTDFAYGIAMDAAGDAYVTGMSDALSQLTTTRGAAQPNFGGGGSDAFVAKFDPTQSGSASLVYATYLGGGAVDVAYGVAVDTVGNAYVTGYTLSPDFPMPRRSSPLQPACNHCASDKDAFVASLNASGTALRYSTYLGGSGSDFGYAIAVDAAGNAYVTGDTGSPADFPVTTTAFRSSNVIGDSFFSKINVDGSALMYSTHLGNANGHAFGIAVDTAGIASVAGYTSSTSFPITADALQPLLNGTGAATTNQDVFVTRIDPRLSNTSSLVYSTYLGGSGGEGSNTYGGIAVDGSGNTYVAGSTSSVDFPVTTNTTAAFQPMFGGGGDDGFVARISPSPVAPPTLPPGAGTAIIDGTLSPGEWSNAICQPFNANVPHGGTVPATLCTMNDIDNMYFSLRFDRATLDPGNTLAIELDGSHDGVVGDGDDVVLFNADGGFVDDFRTTRPPCGSGRICGLMDASDGGTTDGAGAFHHAGSSSVYELSHPLNSGDRHDVALCPGDRIGFFVELRMIGAGGAYPADFADTTWPGWQQYSQIQLKGTCASR